MSIATKKLEELPKTSEYIEDSSLFYIIRKEDGVWKSKSVSLLEIEKYVKSLIYYGKKYE